MSDNKGDTKKKQPHQQQHLSTPPDEDPDQESSQDNPQQPPHQKSPVVVSTVPPFISIPASLTPGGSFEQPHQQQFEAVNPKRPRYTASQWKPISSPSQQQNQQKQSQTNILIAEASPSPTTQAANNPQIPPRSMAASSSETASSPSHSPRPSLSAASGQETTKTEGHQFHQQFRKGKYVSPVWKPNEMLWLARAWRVQYHGPSSEAPEGAGAPITGGEVVATTARVKTRADKDREVAEFLSRHGVNRDAKTAGTKWDNMLGEFRKVYEWERGGEREQVGKSYFRLSPFERKLRRLPASFDEEVFEELSQFMGSRMRSSHNRGGSSALSGGDDGRKALAVTTSLSPPAFREEELPFSGKHLTLEFTRFSDV